MNLKYLFVSLAASCVLGVSAQEMPRYKDSTLPVEERVEDLLRRMSLHDKVMQLQNNSNSDIDNVENNYRESTGSMHEMSKSAKEAAELYRKVQNHLRTTTQWGIPALSSVEGICGVLQNGCTLFPQAIAQGATFNTELIEEMGKAIGREAHVIGVRQLLCPVLDIARELRWGRVEETFGEDPYLIGEMGTSYVKGAQSEGVGAMIKHFVAHGTPTGGLNCASVSGGERELRNLYAYPFAKVINNAAPVAVMSCYSAYDGVPMTHSAYYMTDFLRNELGFKGYVYSDWGSVERLKNFHFATESSADAAKKALMAGIDMDVWDGAYGTLEEQVQKGIIDEYYIDRACRRVLTAKFKLGLFDDGEDAIKPEMVDKVVRCKEHVALARRIAEESVVLAENKNDILPLDMKRYKRIAVLGPNSNYGVGGDYGWVNADHHECVTLYDGLKNAVGGKAEVRQLDGCDWWSQDESGIADAVKLAEESDLAIVAVGTRSWWLGRNAVGNKATAGEGFDLSSLELPGKQLDLIKAVKATGKPVIVALITGKPLVMSWVKEHTDAVLVQFYGGEQQGNALADVLLGKVNPSGKLNVSFPRSTGNLPCFYNHYVTDREFGNDKGGSLDEPRLHYVFEKPYALWNFGHGLSYTTFEFSDVQINDTVFSGNGNVKVSLKVKNTGKRDGKEVVQLYIHDLITSVSQPIQSLKAFKKVFVPAGKEVKVELEMPVQELSFVNEYMKRVVEPGEVEIQIGHASDRIAWRKTVRIK